MGNREQSVMQSMIPIHCMPTVKLGYKQSTTRGQLFPGGGPPLSVLVNKYIIYLFVKNCTNEKEIFNKLWIIYFLISNKEIHVINFKSL